MKPECSGKSQAAFKRSPQWLPLASYMPEEEAALGSPVEKSRLPVPPLGGLCQYPTCVVIRQQPSNSSGPPQGQRQTTFAGDARQRRLANADWSSKGKSTFAKDPVATPLAPTMDTGFPVAAFPPDLPGHASWITQLGQGSACRPPLQGSAGQAPGSPSCERRELAGISALGLRIGTRRPTGWGRALTSAAVRAQEAQEAVASPGDAVAIAVAVAGTVIHRLCGRKEKQSCKQRLPYPNSGPGNPASG